MFDIKSIKKVHLIGIGGISMSAIANIFIDRGIEVTGSDQVLNDSIKKLKKKGADIIIGHDAKIIKNQDIVIYNGAIKNNNPEILEAKEKKIPIYRRTEIIELFMKEHKYSIAIAGTHGKTTSSTMTACLLEESNLNPSFMIGANVSKFNDSHRINDSDYIVIEACEYQGAFLDINPTTILITNIEYEHVDFFKNFHEVLKTFDNFANKLSENGYLVLNNDDIGTRSISNNKKCNIITFGIDNESDYMAKNLKKDELGYYEFDVYKRGNFLVNIKLNVMGIFNVYNALGVIACSDINCVDVAKYAPITFSKFVNAQRRFENIGEYRKMILISDYAHHPSEIKQTLQGALAMDYENVYVIFQPHTYSRSKMFLNEFADSFKGVEKVYLTNIYAAREENIYNIHSKDIVEKLLEKDINCEYIGENYNIEKYLKKIDNTKKNIIIFMGAGDIDDEARHIANLKL